MLPAALLRWVVKRLLSVSMLSFAVRCSQLEVRFEFKSDSTFLTGAPSGLGVASAFSHSKPCTLKITTMARCGGLFCNGAPTWFVGGAVDVPPPAL